MIYWAHFSSFIFFFPLFHEGCGMLPLFIPLRGCGAYWGQIQFYSWAKAHPEWVTSSLQDPYWWQWLPHRVPTAHQEQFWGSVSCSRILWHVAQSSSVPGTPGEPGIWTSDLPITGPPALPTDLFGTFQYATNYVQSYVHPSSTWEVGT